MAKYNLGSETKDCLRKIDEVAQKLRLQYFLIGATARDIIFSQLHDIPEGRATRDIDFSVMVSSWKQYENFIEELIQTTFFEKDHKIKQRLHYLIKTSPFMPVDIIPFGKGVKDSNNKIKWPPNNDIIMSVVGFDEAFNNALMVDIDVGLKIRIVDHAGLFILKLYSWADRKESKDAQDIRYVLDNYDRVVGKETYYNTLNEMDAEGASVDKAGSYLLANDIKRHYSAIMEQAGRLLETEIKQNTLASAMIKSPSSYDEEFTQIEDKLNTLADLLKS